MKKQAILYIVMAGLLWGTSAIFVHFLAPFGITSPQMTAIRGVVSSLCMGVYAFCTDRSLFKIGYKEKILIFFSGLSMFCTATFYYAAMQMTSVSTAVVLMYTAPVLVMIYSVLFLGETLSRLKAISVFCMLVGCMLVSGVIGGFTFHLWGILIGAASGITYSAYNILTKIQMQKGTHPVSASMYCFFYMSVIALLLSSPGGAVTIAAENPLPVIPLMVGLGVCTCVLPYFLYTLALRALPVGTTAALGIIEPMAATLYSVVLFSEPLSVGSLCGIILILGSVLLLSRTER